MCFTSRGYTYYSCTTAILIISQTCSKLNTSYQSRMRSSQGNLAPRPQGRCLRFSCIDQTKKVDELFIIWPFVRTEKRKKGKTKNKKQKQKNKHTHTQKKQKNKQTNKQKKTKNLWCLMPRLGMFLLPNCDRCSLTMHR